MSKSRFQIGLDSFLQMVQMDKTSCTLRVESPAGSGTLYIINGDLVDAECDELSGVEAACEIVSWRDISFEFENICEERIRIINMPLMHLLMEGLKKRDDRDAGIIPERKPAAVRQAGKNVPEKKIPILDIPEAPSYQKQEPPVTEKKPAVAMEPVEPAPPVLTPSDIKTISIPKPQKKSGSGTKKIIMAVFAAFCVAAGIIVYFILAGGPDEKEFRKILAELEQIPDYPEKQRIVQKYIDDHKNSGTIEKAEHQLEQIKKARAEDEYRKTEQLIMGLSPDEDYQDKAKKIYSSYLADNEGTPHKAEVESKIAKISEIYEDALFKMIQGIPDNDFEKKAAETARFLKKFPAGRSSEKAGAILSETENLFFSMLGKMSGKCEEVLDYTPCIEKIESYRKIFGYDSRRYEIDSLLLNMSGERDFIQLKAKADELGDDLEAKRNVYYDYLRNNKNSSAARTRIRGIIDGIEKDIEDRKDWQSTRLYASDPSYPATERTRRLQSFIARKPDSKYTSDAEKMLASTGGGRVSRPEAPTTGVSQKPGAAETARTDNSPVYSKGSSADYSGAWAVIERAAGTRFRNNGNGTITDSMTGKTWCVLDSKADTGRCLNYRDAKSYVNNLSTGGRGGWRLPTSAELYAIYKNSPAIPDTGAQWYWSSDAVWRGLNEIVKIVRPGVTSEIREESLPISECGYVRAVRN